MPIEVHRLGAQGAPDEAEWDRFVRSSADGTPFHRTGWKHVVEGVFRHTPHYLAACSGDQLRAVLPLFEVRGLRSGRCLSSVPYGVYGGICGADEEAAASLIAEARRLGERLRVRHVELRQLHHPLRDLPTRQPFMTFTKPLDPDPEQTFRTLPSKRRGTIRKARRAGLEARRGWDALAEFHRIYLDDRSRLGAPPFPLRLFAAIRDHFGSDAELLSIWHRERLVSGVLTLFHGDRVIPYYGASRPEARALAANDFMYWELMRAACVAGHRLFDFGQSHAGAGTYEYKRLWGFEAQPISHQYVLVRATEAPNVEPGAGPSRAVEAWKHLPVPVTKWLGPALIRWLPLH